MKKFLVTIIITIVTTFVLIGCNTITTTNNETTSINTETTTVLNEEETTTKEKQTKEEEEETTIQETTLFEEGFINIEEETIETIVATEEEEEIGEEASAEIIEENNESVYELGLNNYGISYLDTERSLKLITYEGYGYSPLSYYVACCCWTRATEGYWGYGNLYSAFGEIDTHYGEWMDSLGIADYAYDTLYQCYANPMYVKYCNGMAAPSNYIYYENGIYVWN